MPALLLAAALAAGQPADETIRPVDPAAPARASLVQDLAAVVSGTAPFAGSAGALRSAADSHTGSIALRQTGEGLIAMGTDTGLNSVTQSALAVSARVTLSRLP